MRNEVARVHPETNVPDCDDSDDPSRVHDVYILGGDVAVDPQVETQLAKDGYCVKRLFGPSRVETSIAVARQLLRITVEPSSGQTGTANAALYDLPIVVTATDSLHPEVQALISDSLVKRAAPVHHAARRNRGAER